MIQLYSLTALLMSLFCILRSESIVLTDTYISNSWLSWSPCYVALVIMPIHNLLSSVQPIISETDVPRCQTTQHRFSWSSLAALPLQHFRCYYIFESSISQASPHPRKCGLSFPDASNRFSHLPYVFCLSMKWIYGVHTSRPLI